MPDTPPADDRHGGKASPANPAPPDGPATPGAPPPPPPSGPACPVPPRGLGDRLLCAALPFVESLRGYNVQMLRADLLARSSPGCIPNTDCTRPSCR